MVMIILIMSERIKSQKKNLMGSKKNGRNDDIKLVSDHYRKKHFHDRADQN